MTFDQRQRYEVVRAVAAALDCEVPLRLLDVGGLARTADGTVFLPLGDVVHSGLRIVVDRQLLSPNDKLPARSEAFAPGGQVGRVSAGAPWYVTADALQLPFPDASFDVVSCLDVVEHVPRHARHLVTSELLRVARACVVIAVPVADDGAEARETALARFIRTTLGADHEQLAEHAAHGLPTDAEMLDLLPAGTRSFGYGSLDAWFAMMVAKYFLARLPHSKEVSDALDEAYADQQFACDRTPPFYRRFYLAPARSGAGARSLERVLEQYCPVRGEVTDILPWIFTVLGEADASRLAAERVPLEAQVESLTRLFRDVEQSLVYRLYRLIKR